MVMYTLYSYISFFDYPYQIHEMAELPNKESTDIGVLLIWYASTSALKEKTATEKKSGLYNSNRHPAKMTFQPV